MKVKFTLCGNTFCKISVIEYQNVIDVIESVLSLKESLYNFIWFYKDSMAVPSSYVWRFM